MIIRGLRSLESIDLEAARSGLMYFRTTFSNTDNKTPI